jgi:beta-galactosidase GanA
LRRPVLFRLADLRGSVAAAMVAGLMQALTTNAAAASPQPRVDGGAAQLIVDAQPFLIRGGELRNSTASSPCYLDQFWGKLERMGLNTVLAPAYWELIEPGEGKFDFQTVDGLIKQARRHHLHVVLLWFGSWKNGASSYVPAWIKRDQARFARVERSGGAGLEILSAVSASNLEADAQAFSMLLDHLRAVDGMRHTVIMVQVENEIGLKPEPRDHSAAANGVFAAPVPAELISYLTAHRNQLAPEVESAWRSHGFKSGASWEETFGAGPQTDELFNAWVEARYTGLVAARGKAKYNLPLYVNAALIREGFEPGRYPSGGPLPHLFDIWHAAAPAIDLISPDLYFPNFPEWTAKYSRPDNVLFVPEVGGTTVEEMAANAFFAIGELNAIGFSPFGIETFSDEQAKTLAHCYDVLEQLTPLIVANRGNRKMHGMRPVIHYDGTVESQPQRFELGAYQFSASFPPSGSFIDPASSSNPVLAHGGLIVQTGPDEFVVAGTGVTLSFAANDVENPLAGVLEIQEGHFSGGRWKPGRYLNGDETDNGSHIHLPMHDFGILRVRLYRYH